MGLVFGGVEGGATETHIYLISASGDLLASASTTSSNVWTVGFSPVADLLVDLIHVAKEKAGIPATAPLATLGLALSGMDGDSDQEKLKALLLERDAHIADSIRICTDVVGSIFTANPHGGVVIIAGTGSAARLARKDGTHVRSGGWGHMIGDEGSACWIVRRCVKLVYRLMDNNFKNYQVEKHYDPAPIYNELRAYFRLAEQGNRSDILPDLYSNFNKTHFAGFCVRIVQFAERGDRLCLDLLHKAGASLARMIASLVPSMDESAVDPQGNFRVTVVGSVWKSFPLFRSSFYSTLEQTLAAQDKPLQRPLVLQRLTERSCFGAAVWAANGRLTLDHSAFVETL